MKKITILLILVLLHCNVFAFSPLLVCSGKNSTSESVTTYYFGLNNNHTTTRDTTAPVSSASLGSDNGVYQPVTFPAGSTVIAVWVYYVDGTSITAAEIAMYEYTDATTGGNLLSSASVSPVNNTWTKSSDFSSGTYTFESETQVYFGTAYQASGGVTLGRNTSPAVGTIYGSSTYGTDPLGSLSSSSSSYGIIVEYEN